MKHAALLLAHTVTLDPLSIHALAVLLATLVSLVLPVVRLLHLVVVLLQLPSLVMEQNRAETLLPVVVLVVSPSLASDMKHVTRLLMVVTLLKSTSLVMGKGLAAMLPLMVFVFLVVILKEELSSHAMDLEHVNVLLVMVV